MLSSWPHLLHVWVTNMDNQSLQARGNWISGMPDAQGRPPHLINFYPLQWQLREQVGPVLSQLATESYSPNTTYKAGGNAYIYTHAKCSPAQPCQALQQPVLVQALQQQKVAECKDSYLSCDVISLFEILNAIFTKSLCNSSHDEFTHGKCRPKA